jgi:hypothetical protein
MKNARSKISIMYDIYANADLNISATASTGGATGGATGLIFERDPAYQSPIVVDNSELDGIVIDFSGLPQGQSKPTDDRILLGPARPSIQYEESSLSRLMEVSLRTSRKLLEAFCTHLLTPKMECPRSLFIYLLKAGEDATQSASLGPARTHPQPQNTTLR